MAEDAIIVRRARKRDLPTLARFGAALARAHHEWDPKRFFVHEPMERGYAWWLGEELKNPRAVLLAAEHGGRIVGYAYGRLEPRDWNSLREACGVGVDLIVDPEARGLGAGRRLCEALIASLRGLGANQVVLQAAARNREAQRFFRGLGFRPTMIEMTLDLPEGFAEAPRAAGRRGGEAQRSGPVRRSRPARPEGSSRG